VARAPAIERSPGPSSIGGETISVGARSAEAVRPRIHHRDGFVWQLNPNRMSF